MGIGFLFLISDFFRRGETEIETRVRRGPRRAGVDGGGQRDSFRRQQDWRRREQPDRRGKWPVNFELHDFHYVRLIFFALFDWLFRQLH